MGSCGNDIVAGTSDMSDGKKLEQKERFLQELSHLEKAHKSGLVSLQEYKVVKQALEKKLTVFENHVKQDAAKERAVHKLVGKPLTPIKKGSEKYFMKLDKAKEVSFHSPALPAKTTKNLSKKVHKKEIPSLETSSLLSSQESPEKLMPVKQDIPIALHSDSSSNSSPPTQDSHTYKNIEELLDDQESHWRLGFVMLTLFLLILLYVKFTSFGVVSSAVSIDAYLEYSSSYSHETYDILQELVATYGNQLRMNYHLVGTGEQNALASAAIACAEDQRQGGAYLQALFSKDPASWKTMDDLLLFTQELGLEGSLFQLCMEGDVKTMLYSGEVDAALAADITYTPTLVINSKKIVGAVGIEAIQQVIDSELTTVG